VCGAHEKTSVAHALRFVALSREPRNNAWSHFAHGVGPWGRDGGMDMNLINRLVMLAKTEDGQDLLEYALLVALIALVCVGAIGLAGTNVNTIFGRIATALAPSA
jgi:pilus assembly protein Flp/PilA